MFNRRDGVEKRERENEPIERQRNLCQTPRQSNTFPKLGDRPRLIELTKNLRSDAKDGAVLTEVLTGEDHETDSTGRSSKISQLSNKNARSACAAT